MRNHPGSRSILWIAIGALLLTMPGCLIGNRVSLAGALDKSEGLQEKTIIAADKTRCKNKVLMIDISGILGRKPKKGMFGGYEPDLQESIRSVLDKAREDKHVKALLLRINSPGGEVTVTDIIYDELIRFKEDHDAKVVAAMMQVAASGGYYLACASDHIIAHPTTLTGSISVIRNAFNIEGLMGKVGVEHEALKSGDKKDMGSPFRAMTDEERALMQEMILAVQGRFLDVVEAGRPNLTRERIEQLADGRVYTAGQALEVGLVDEIGYLENAFETAKKEAKLKDASLVVYTYYPGRPLNIYSPTATTPMASPFDGLTQNQVLRYLEQLGELGHFSLLCLWDGGLAEQME